MLSIKQKIIRAAVIAAPLLLIALIITGIVFKITDKPNKTHAPVSDDTVAEESVPVINDDITFDKNESSESTISEESTPSFVGSDATTPPVQNNDDTSSSETRAVWISFLEMQEILTEKSRSQFTASICEYLDNCKSAGINTVIFHARSHGDAFYKSALFPTSVHFTGTRQETAPFDPLEITVHEAHTRGIRVEAWINPYRGPELEDGKPLLDNGIFSKWLNTDNVFICDNGGHTYYYLNPASPEAQKYVLDGVREIVAGYDVDGIHFDDYFYPTTDEWVDAAYYAQYGNGLSLADYRRKCVSDFIADVYSTIKSIRDIPFGISPAGNIQSNIDNYYADVKLWCSKSGYVDYIMPQIYWAFGEGSLSFEKALSQWENLVTSNDVKLMIGLAAYKVGINEYWSEGDVLSRQIELSRKANRYSGYAFFRYSLLFSPACDTERQNLFKN